MTYLPQICRICIFYIPISVTDIEDLLILEIQIDKNDIHFIPIIQYGHTFRAYG